MRSVDKSGVGTYVRNLYQAMVDIDASIQYTFIVKRGRHHGELERPNVRVVETNAPYYSVREQLYLPGLLWRLRPHLFHSPHFLLPLVRPCQSVVTIHDAAYLVDDSDLSGFRQRAYYRNMFLYSVKAAAEVITDSQFSKEELVRVTGRSASSITVIPLGVASNFRPASAAEQHRIRNRIGVNQPFLLYLGIQRNRKNVAGMLRAFALFAREDKSNHLFVIAGTQDPVNHGRLVVLARELGIEERVRFVGRMDDGDLPALYSAAAVTVFATLYEGFGLPVLESMACGTPVIASATSSLPEVAGHAAAYVDPLRPESIANAMQQVTMNPQQRTHLIELGIRRAAQFSWSATACRTLEVFHRLLARSAAA